MTSVIEGGTAVRLSKTVFSLDAIKRASYALMARYDVAISLEDDDVVCMLRPALPNLPMNNAERDFRREVVDQDLRISIEERTEAYRDAIIGLAFSKTGLQDG